MKNGGYTLVEMMVAVSIGTLAIAAACVGIGMSARASRDGLEQVQYNAMARLCTQRIRRFVEDARAVKVANGTRADLVFPDLRVGSLCFQDGDCDSATVLDNVIVWDPDTSVFGDERAVCSHVCPDTERPIFEQLQSGVVKIFFRVGEPALEIGSVSGRSGFSGAGAIVTATVACRNDAKWYDR